MDRTHIISHNIATDPDKVVLQYQVEKNNTSFVIKYTGLDAEALITFSWSNNGSSLVALTDANDTGIELTLPSGSGEVGIQLTNISAKYIHIAIDKQTATAGIITEIISTYI